MLYPPNMSQLSSTEIPPSLNPSNSQDDRISEDQSANDKELLPTSLQLRDQPLSTKPPAAVYNGFPDHGFPYPRTFIDLAKALHIQSMTQRLSQTPMDNVNRQINGHPQHVIAPTPMPEDLWMYNMSRQFHEAWGSATKKAPVHLVLQHDIMGGVAPDNIYEMDPVGYEGRLSEILVRHITILGMRHTDAHREKSATGSMDCSKK